VRLRSLPVDLESKMPRALQIKAGRIDASRGPGSAYIRFIDPGAAHAALSLNMSVFEGHHIRVDAVTRSVGNADQPKVQYDPKLSVFVGNLPPNVQVRAQGVVEPCSAKRAWVWCTLPLRIR
jgi:hypothetical protein